MLGCHRVSELRMAVVTVNALYFYLFAVDINNSALYFNLSETYGKFYNLATAFEIQVV